MKIVLIKALDHFETEDRGKYCEIEVLGEVIEENEEYLYLRKMSWDMVGKDKPPVRTDQIEGIVKSAIIKRTNFIQEEMQ